MERSVFVCRCPGCETILGAYDPFRCDFKSMGEAVRNAAKDGLSVAIVEGPVLVGGSCKCKPKAPEQLLLAIE